MGVDVMRAQLMERIQNGNEQLIRVMYAIVEAVEESTTEDTTDEMLMALASEQHMKRLTAEDLLARLEASSAQVARGEYITIEALEKEMQEW